MRIDEIENAGSEYQYNRMKMEKVMLHPVSCEGCNHPIPVGAFFFTGFYVKLCVDCADACISLFRKLTPEQKAESRVTVFSEQSDWLDAYRVRAVPATKTFEVKMFPQGHWFKTTEEFFLYLVSQRGYRKSNDESFGGFDVYGKGAKQNEQQPSQAS